jgi:hypothetical protein
MHAGCLHMWYCFSPGQLVKGRRSRTRKCEARDHSKALRQRWERWHPPWYVALRLISYASVDALDTVLLVQPITRRISLSTPHMMSVALTHLSRQLGASNAQGWSRPKQGAACLAPYAPQRLKRVNAATAQNKRGALCSV